MVFEVLNEGSRLEVTGWEEVGQITGYATRWLHHVTQGQVEIGAGIVFKAGERNYNSGKSARMRADRRAAMNIFESVQYNLRPRYGRRYTSRTLDRDLSIIENYYSFNSTINLV